MFDIERSTIMEMTQTFYKNEIKIHSHCFNIVSI